MRALETHGTAYSLQVISSMGISAIRKKTVYFIYSCFTILGVLGTLPTQAQIPSYAESIRQKTDSILNLQTVYNLKDLSGLRVERFSIPNQWHTTGQFHSAIYKASFRGRPTLIKTILPDKDFYDDDSLRKEVFAMLLASGIGGPQIYRAGKLLNEKDIAEYFIQMEEIFPDDKNSFTFKGLGRKDPIDRWLFSRSPSQAQLKQIGIMINLALERGIQINVDHDFIFNSKGDQVRWIDTSQWRIAGIDFIEKPIKEVVDFSQNKHISKMSLHYYGYLLTLFFYQDESYGILVLESLLRSIQNSQIWSESQKKQLVENLKTTFILNWKMSPGLFEEAMSRSKQTVSKNGCIDMFQSLFGSAKKLFRFPLY